MEFKDETLLLDISNLTKILHQQEVEICNSTRGMNGGAVKYVACVIAVVTILENCIILAAIFRGHPSLRTPPYWFIANLAVADALTGIGVLVAIFLPIGDSPSSRIAIKGFTVVTFIVSINSLLFVSIDRYVRIVHFTNYKESLSQRKILGMISISWVISLCVFLIVPLVGWSCGKYYCCAYNGPCTCLRSKHGEDICRNSCSQSFVPFQKPYLLVGVLYFFIAVASMTTIYAVIFRVVKKKTFPEDQLRKNKGQINLAKTLIITLGIFVICWLPVVGLFIADLTMHHKSTTLTKVFDFALVPTVINSLLNPIIYSIRMPRMRATIKHLVLPCFFPGDKART